MTQNKYTKDVFQPLVSSIKTYPIATFDIEAEDWINPIACGWFTKEHDYNEIEGANCVDKFLQFIIDNDLTAYNWYAHYGGKFDYLHLIKSIIHHPLYNKLESNDCSCGHSSNNHDNHECKYNCKSFILQRRLHIKPIFGGSRILSLKLYIGKLRWKLYHNRGKGGRWYLCYPTTCYHFIDSFNLLKMSLDDATYEFGVENRKMSAKDLLPKTHNLEALKLMFSMDYIKQHFIYTKWNWKNNPEFRKYLKKDVIGLNEVLVKFQSILNESGGEMKLTAASCSLDLFKRKYLKYPFSCHKESEDFIRQGFYGGRVEIFKLLGGHNFDNSSYNVYDFNSLYPYVMKNNPFPIGKGFFKNVNIDIEKDFGWWLCKIKTPKNLDIPVLPFKNNDKKLIFPLGEFEGIYSSSLLRYALMFDYEITPIKGYKFEYDTNLFNEFIDSLFQLKNEADIMGQDGKRELYKLMLTSFFGKFGQKREKDQLLVNPILKPTQLENAVVFNERFNLIKITEKNDSPNILPGIASQVTSLAIIKQHHLLYESNNRGILYYSDTDSVHTTKKWDTGRLLGELKHEYIVDEGYYLQPKTYALRGYDLKKKEFRTKMCAKGFSKLNLNFNDFKNAILDMNLKPFSQLNRNIMPFKRAMIHNRRLNDLNILFVEERIKQIKSMYDKRAILANGKTEPLIIEA